MAVHIAAVDENTLRNDPNKLLLFRTLKYVWCTRATPDYRFLVHFLNKLAPGQMTEFVRAVCQDFTWTFDNDRVLQPYRTRVPRLFLWLAESSGQAYEPAVDEIVDTLGSYCTSTTVDVLRDAAVRLFHRHDFEDPEVIRTVLREPLERANLLNSPPTRDDICYRFTRLCSTLIQKIRDVV